MTGTHHQKNGSKQHLVRCSKHWKLSGKVCFQKQFLENLWLRKQVRWGIYSATNLKKDLNIMTRTWPVLQIAIWWVKYHLYHILTTFRLYPDKKHFNASYKKAPMHVWVLYVQGQQSVWECGRPLQCSSRRDNDGFPHHVEVNWQTVPLGESIPYARLYTQNTQTNHIQSTNRLIAMTSRCACTHTCNTHNNIHLHKQ